MIHRRSFVVCSLLATLAAVAGGCDGTAERAAGPAPTPEPSVVGQLRVLNVPSTFAEGALMTYWAWIQHPTAGAVQARNLVWESSDPGVARIVSSGGTWVSVWAIAPGTATLTVHALGTDTVRIGITVRSRSTPVSPPSFGPIEVTSFRVMYRPDGVTASYIPIATIAPRSKDPVVIRMGIELPGLPPFPGTCHTERTFTKEAQLFGRSYGDWEIEFGADINDFPTAQPILHLLVRDSVGALHNVDVTGELIPFDAKLDWPSDFSAVGWSCS